MAANKSVGDDLDCQWWYNGDWQMDGRGQHTLVRRTYCECTRIQCIV